MASGSTPGNETAIAPYRGVLDHAGAAPMLEQTLAWSAVNSGSHNLPGLRQVASLLADAFAQLPGDLRLIAADSHSQVAVNGTISEVACGDTLLLTVRPQAPVQLLMTGHMDTVYPAESPFQQCTFPSEDIVNGPGVADMKGGIAVILSALTAFETWPGREAVGYQVLINGDEEIGSPGSAALIRQTAPGKRAALTYEPAALPDGTLAGARPGSGNFSIIITGKSAHAGRNPKDGRNAIVAAADLTLRLAALARDGITVNPARIDGGAANNVVPAQAIVRVNIRSTTPADQDLAQRGLDAAVAAVTAAHSVSAQVHGSFGRPPKVIDAGAQRLSSLVRETGAWLGQTIAWRDTGGVCDGNNIAACGIPVVDTMGVRGGDIHSPSEYLIVPSLAERAWLSALLLCRFGDGHST